MTRKNLSKDSKYRKETKEEKRARLETAQASKEACRRITPYILGVILILIGSFSYYVNTVPLRTDPAAAAADGPLKAPKIVEIPVEEVLEKTEDVPLETKEKVDIPPREVLEKTREERNEAEGESEPVAEL